MHLCISYYDRIASAITVCPKYGIALLLQTTTLKCFTSIATQLFPTVIELNCIDRTALN